mmetsp:Transcript_55420/g.127407  ORF Transcript_55420/g.127407 Transcript_55420/m.127407 type:complete len:218 (+) Transcript_55420:929-1582(+)
MRAPLHAQEGLLLRPAAGACACDGEQRGHRVPGAALRAAGLRGGPRGGEAARWANAPECNLLFRGSHDLSKSPGWGLPRPADETRCTDVLFDVEPSCCTARGSPQSRHLPLPGLPPSYGAPVFGSPSSSRRDAAQCGVSGSYSHSGDGYQRGPVVLQALPFAGVPHHVRDVCGRGLQHAEASVRLRQATPGRLGHLCGVEELRDGMCPEAFYHVGVA